MEKLIAKNDSISLILSDIGGDERVIFLDSDERFINDWYVDVFDNRKECLLEVVKILAFNDEELTWWFSDSVGYKTDVFINATEEQIKQMKTDFDEDCINRIGNNYLAFYL